jgi:hypothetical protein
MSEELDLDTCLNIFFELIREQGEEVCSLYWDSGGPGAGAGTEKIYKFRDLYWPCDSDQGFAFGPEESLQEAMDGCFQITGATKSVTCEELSAAELAQSVRVQQAIPGQLIEINGEEWRMSETGMLERRP